MDAVENELGLCARIEATHAALLRSIASGGSCCAAWRLEHRSASEATAEPALPPLAELVRAQRYTRPRMCSVDAPALLRPPLLYGALVHNRDPEHERTVEALQASWRLPPQSAFLLSDMTRWPELAALRPAGGYRVILADPPWHSHSAQVGPSRCCPPPLAALLLLQLLLTLLQHTAPPLFLLHVHQHRFLCLSPAQRAAAYATLDKRDLLALPVPQLADSQGCLLLFWVTNSRHVQHFVEEVLFPRWGALRPLALAIHPALTRVTPPRTVTMPPGQAHASSRAGTG